MQVQSAIKTVLEEVEDALQLLHSQVHFRLHVTFLIQSVDPPYYRASSSFPLAVLQLKRTIVSIALWNGEHDCLCKK